MTTTPLDVEQAVGRRYSQGALARDADLCCPVGSAARYLDVIPREILERDYGCGDPSRHIRAGETVLDLGSGSGKTCLIASQLVGPEGWVIGVDMNSDMLALARRHQRTVGERIGWHNVEFRRGRIQDLRLDLDALDRWLGDHPVRTADDLAALDRERARIRQAQPLVPDQSIDVVVSNCVLNLVSDEEKQRPFAEIFRVLRPGGRAVVSDIVADEPVPEYLKADPALWSGCLSGAMTEVGFLEAFEAAGFHGIELLSRNSRPWRTIAGIEFRSVTVQAFRGKDGPCLETHKAVIYRGPWRQVVDDDGHVFRRGVRSAVCEKTFNLVTGPPYAGQLEPVLPLVSVEPEEACPFDCSRTTPRQPRETKGMDYDVTTAGTDSSCVDRSCC